MQNSLLIIFSRAPALGKVKSRLASTLGPEKALSIHNLLFKQTIATVLQSRIPNKIYLSEEPLPSFKYPYLLQTGHDLGNKMNNALEKELSTHSKVLLIGSDCLNLTSNDLTNSLAKLETNDVVLGPAVDGGYYLIGLKKPTPNLFNSIQWGTSTVLQETINRCISSGLSYELLDMRSDVDTEDDIPDGWV